MVSDTVGQLMPPIPYAHVPETSPPIRHVRYHPSMWYVRAIGDARHGHSRSCEPHATPGPDVAHGSWSTQLRATMLGECKSSQR
eukprot:2869430-Rhodomonas_salina.1